MPDSARIDLRNRFVGFAFAAADLLVEIAADRRVTFAAGAFRERFGLEADAYTGRDIAGLVAQEDQAALELALSLIAARGRLPPVSLRLSNTERTPMALSGLKLPNPGGIAWLTFARVPSPGPTSGALAGAAALRGAVDARTRAGAASSIGLVEINGWGTLGADQRRTLEDGIERALRDAGGEGAMAAGMAEGRFGVLAEAPLNMQELQATVAKILRAGGARQIVSGMTIPIAPVPDADPAAAIRAMRFALASFSERGTAAVRKAGFDAGLRGFLAQTETRAQAVRAAIDAGRFRLVFQPVVDLHTRVPHHFEALLRPHPVSGEETTTQEFVRFAEAVGLAEALDTAVLERAAESLRQARARVAINISGISMQSAAFRARLLDTLTRTPGLRRQLMVELTETADIEDVGGAVDTVNQLSAAGVPVCLDDFGAGFSAFRYLREFHVDYVKIDGSFVQQALAGARESGFITAMVELARCASAETIAEMVETEEQASAMRDLGVKLGQGWLFGKPGRLPGSL